MNGVLALGCILMGMYVLFIIIDEVTKEPPPPPEKTKEEKRAIVIEALKGDFKKVAEEKGVSEDDIKKWKNELFSDILDSEHAKEDLLDILDNKF
ncbi:MAG: hypothetical protein MJ081_06365 [Ruminococcus sp.]|nr:hypothetical protein [Ruminococcus sp.]